MPHTTQISVFIGKFAHQFPRHVAFYEIQNFHERFIFVTKHRFDITAIFSFFHNTCLHKFVCYLQRIFNRNRKLKQNALKLGMLKNQCMLHFRLHFLPGLPKFEVHNVVRQTLKLWWELLGPIWVLMEI